MIDAEGYRPNIGIILLNAEDKVFWAKRIGQPSWQFPQGGMQEGEDVEQAMYRELREETGLNAEDVEILYVTERWLRYKLPRKLVRKNSNVDFVGQTQKWFFLRLIAKPEKINLSRSMTPEFDSWSWVSYWYPLRYVVSFKRGVYRKAMLEFAFKHFRSEKSKRFGYKTIYLDVLAN